MLIFQSKSITSDASFSDKFAMSGEYGFYILLVFFISFGLLIALTAIIKKHKKYIYSGVFASLPFLTGVYSSYLANRIVDEEIKNNPGMHEQQAIDMGYEIARLPIELGWKFSIPILIFFIVTYVIKRKK